MVIVGWSLIIGGVIAILAGIIGGIAQMFIELKQQLQNRKSFALVDIEAILPTKFLEALTKLLEALTKAKSWLALVFVGIVAIAIGIYLISTAS